MSEGVKAFINTTRDGFVYWRIAIAKCIVKMLITGLAAFLAAVQSVDWNALDGFQKMCIILGAFIVAGGVIDAFLDSTMSELRKSNSEQQEPK